MVQRKIPEIMIMACPKAYGSNGRIIKNITGKDIISMVQGIRNGNYTHQMTG